MGDPNALELFGKSLLDKLLNSLPKAKKADPQEIVSALSQTEGWILVLSSRDRMGDVLCSTPVLDNLKAAFPTYRIAFLVHGYPAPAIANHPQIDRLIIYPEGALGHLVSVTKIVFSLRTLHPRACFVLTPGNTSLTAALLAKLSDSHFIVGFETDAGKRPYSRLFYNYAVQSSNTRKTEANLDILRSLQIPTPHHYLSAGFSSQGLAKARVFLSDLKKKGPIVGIHPGGAQHLSQRISPPELFLAAARSAIDAGAQIIAIQGPGEETSVQNFQKSAGFSCPVAALDLDALKALLSQLDLLIANDGGTIHLAAAVKTPVLAFFKASDPALWKPAGEIVSVVDVRKMELPEAQRLAQIEVRKLLKS